MIRFREKLLNRLKHYKTKAQISYSLFQASYGQTLDSSLTDETKLKVAINSCAEYLEMTLPKMIKSLRKLGLKREQIYIFIGSAPELSITEKKDYILVSLPFNGIDFNSYAGILQTGIRSDYWLMVHDTVLFGKKLLNKIPVNRQFDYLPLTHDSRKPSMNMGVFSQAYLERVREVIFSYVQYKPTKEDLQRLKKHIVETEDVLMPEMHQALNKTSRKYFGVIDFYGTGSPRLTEFYPDISLIKLKSNWQLAEKYSTDI